MAAAAGVGRVLVAVSAAGGEEPPTRRERNPWNNEFISIARVNSSQLRGELRKKRLHGTEEDPPVARGGFVAGGKIGAAAAGKKKGGWGVAGLTDGRVTVGDGGGGALCKGESRAAAAWGRAEGGSDVLWRAERRKFAGQGRVEG
jgi:hypothetical protein